MVGPDAVFATTSLGRFVHSVNHPTLVANNYLVGSAEQSFIQRMMDGSLPRFGKYQAITPCFRDDEIDDQHQQYFMKLELIHVGANHDSLAYVLKDAVSVIRSLTSRRINVVKTEDGYDICSVQDDMSLVEIGSYGYRELASDPSIKWVYGTGLAEPRFSTFAL